MELPLRKIQLQISLPPQAAARRLSELTAAPEQQQELTGQVSDRNFRVGLPGRSRLTTVVLEGAIEPDDSGAQLQAELRLNQAGIGSLLISVLAGIALSAFFLSQKLPLSVALLPNLLVVSNLLSAYSTGQRLTRRLKRLLT